jgi:uncharacterized protein YejL (UPF0352 family)
MEAPVDMTLIMCSFNVARNVIMISFDPVCRASLSNGRSRNLIPDIKVAGIWK